MAILQQILPNIRVYKYSVHCTLYSTIIIIVIWPISMYTGNSIFLFIIIFDFFAESNFINLSGEFTLIKNLHFCFTLLSNSQAQTQLECVNHCYFCSISEVVIKSNVNGVIRNSVKVDIFLNVMLSNSFDGRDLNKSF